MGRCSYDLSGDLTSIFGAVEDVLLELHNALQDPVVRRSLQTESKSDRERRRGTEDVCSKTGSGELLTCDTYREWGS